MMKIFLLPLFLMITFGAAQANTCSHVCYEMVKDGTVCDDARGDTIQCDTGSGPSWIQKGDTIYTASIAANCDVQTAKSKRFGGFFTGFAYCRIANFACRDVNWDGKTEYVRTYQTKHSYQSETGAGECR